MKLLLADPKQKYLNENDMLRRHPFGVAINTACNSCGVQFSEVKNWGDDIEQDFLIKNMYAVPSTEKSKIRGSPLSTLDSTGWTLMQHLEHTAKVNEDQAKMIVRLNAKVESLESQCVEMNQKLDLVLNCLKEYTAGDNRPDKRRRYNNDDIQETFQTDTHDTVLDYELFKKLLQTSFEQNVTQGIVFYLEKNGYQSYLDYTGKKAAEKMFTTGITNLVLKVTALIPDSERKNILPPSLSEGEAIMITWRKKISLLIDMCYSNFCTFLVENNVLNENEQMTKSKMKNLNSKITKLYKEKMPHTVKYLNIDEIKS